MTLQGTGEWANVACRRPVPLNYRLTRAQNFGLTNTVIEAGVGGWKYLCTERASAAWLKSHPGPWASCPSWLEDGSYAVHSKHK